MSIAVQWDRYVYASSTQTRVYQVHIHSLNGFVVAISRLLTRIQPAAGTSPLLLHSYVEDNGRLQFRWRIRSGCALYPQAPIPLALPFRVFYELGRDVDLVANIFDDLLATLSCIVCGPSVSRHAFALVHIVSQCCTALLALQLRVATSAYSSQYPPASPTSTPR